MGLFRKNITVVVILAQMKKSMRIDRETSPMICWLIKQRSMSPIYSTVYSRTTTTVLGQTSEVNFTIKSQYEIFSKNVFAGNSTLIEVNMQVRSMGPISEMDMVRN